MEKFIIGGKKGIMTKAKHKLYVSLMCMKGTNRTKWILSIHNMKIDLPDPAEWIGEEYYINPVLLDRQIPVDVQEPLQQIALYTKAGRFGVLEWHVKDSHLYSDVTYDYRTSFDDLVKKYAT